jgi:hypothetical protein
MSQSTESRGYRRDNFWGEITDYDDEPEPAAGDYGVGDGSDENPGPAGTWHPDPNDINEIIAHRLLRDTAKMLCSETLFVTPALEGGQVEQLCRFFFEPAEEWREHNPEAHHTENREVELSEPELRPPTETVRDQRHRVRVNDEVGYLSGGHSTGVVLQDRSLEEFIAVLNLWLEGRNADVPDSIKADARDKAYRLKREGKHRDIEILTDVVEFVRSETK